MPYPLSWVLTLEFKTYIDPKEEISTYLFWDCPRLD
jgi:hypothetical protein